MNKLGEWFIQVFGAADVHATAAGDSDFAVGDLQILFRRAFSLLTEEQRSLFFKNVYVAELFNETPEYEGLGQ